MKNKIFKILFILSAVFLTIFIYSILKKKEINISSEVKEKLYIIQIQILY